MRSHRVVKAGPRALARGAGVALLLAAAAAGSALARNPHCSGGILYVTQGMRDKDKGDMEGYARQMGKAVFELEQCATEAPDDFEAHGYLGWAYAEIESSCAAGRAFAAAIEGLAAKGDRKKVDWATSNRNSYWARAFNAGIEQVRIAQQAYPEFTKPAADEAETTLKGEAERYYQEALASFSRAACLRPNDPQTIRNLGSVHAFMGEFVQAEAVFKDGLRMAPGDSALDMSLKSVRTSYARSLVDAKKYDQAIAYFGDLLKGEPDFADHHLSVAGAYFGRAQGQEGEARRADFKRAGEAYARAGELKPTDPDLPYNAALAFQNAGEWQKSEVQWRRAAKLRPDDFEVLSSLGAVLAEQKKFPEAIRLLHTAVNLQPQNKALHRQLGAIYTKAENNGKATEELMVYLAMHNGQPVADPAAATAGARPETAAGKTLANEGPPDQVFTWEAEKVPYDTWFYWSKKRAFTFQAGTLVTKSDWSVADTLVRSTVPRN